MLLIVLGNAYLSKKCHLFIIFVYYFLHLFMYNQCKICLSIYFDRLCPFCRSEDLRIPFERFGPVRDVYLPKNYYTGYAFPEPYTRDWQLQLFYHVKFDIVYVLPCLFLGSSRDTFLVNLNRLLAMFLILKYYFIRW